MLLFPNKRPKTHWGEMNGENTTLTLFNLNKTSLQPVSRPVEQIWAFFNLCFKTCVPQVKKSIRILMQKNPQTRKHLKQVRSLLYIYFVSTFRQRLVKITKNIRHGGQEDPGRENRSCDLIKRTVNLNQFHLYSVILTILVRY